MTNISTLVMQNANTWAMGGKPPVEEPPGEKSPPVKEPPPDKKTPTEDDPPDDDDGNGESRDANYTAERILGLVGKSVSS